MAVLLMVCSGGKVEVKKRFVKYCILENSSHQRNSDSTTFSDTID
jgi:hypothetical protein